MYCYRPDDGASENRMQKAVEMHLAARQADGDEIPEPSLLKLVEVG
jgi:hypothetical protein